MSGGYIEVGALVFIAGLCVNLMALFPLASSERQRRAFRRLWRVGPALGIIGLLASALGGDRSANPWLVTVSAASLFWCVVGTAREVQSPTARATPVARISTLRVVVGISGYMLGAVAVFTVGS